MFGFLDHGISDITGLDAAKQRGFPGSVHCDLVCISPRCIVLNVASLIFNDDLMKLIDVQLSMFSVCPFLVIALTRLQDRPEARTLCRAEMLKQQIGGFLQNFNIGRSLSAHHGLLQDCELRMSHL